MNYNGTSVDKVIYNNVIVWEKILFEDISFGYTRKIKSVEVPPGLYKLEVCGAQGGNSPNGGRGWYGGGQGCHYNGASPGGGGSGYIGENSITHDGVTYINSCTTSSHTGHGSAKISFIAP